MASTNGHGPKRAILYARVSTDEQARSGYSLAQQIEALRRLMCNELDQQICQVTQRSAEDIVDPLSTGVRCDLCCKASQQPTEGLGSVAL